MSALDSAWTSQPLPLSARVKVRLSTYLHSTCQYVSHDVPHPPLGHGGGVRAGNLGGLSAAGQLVQALLATWQLVTVRGSHGADLNLSKKIYIRFKKKKCCLHSRPRD